MLAPIINPPTADLDAGPTIDGADQGTRIEETLYPTTRSAKRKKNQICSATKRSRVANFRHIITQENVESPQNLFLFSMSLSISLIQV
jgi:hypothetical protein